MGEEAHDGPPTAAKKRGGRDTRRGEIHRGQSLRWTVLELDPHGPDLTLLSGKRPHTMAGLPDKTGGGFQFFFF